ncbi:hypothetical protein [Actinomadura oligospora]|uniref:hypothetical protein n=1 Tax=Actinomadura oligospora TaxID=111804 RepID=UPI0012FB3307|nr:hypothetical protein [Actinomadura oligospora]
MPHESVTPLVPQAPPALRGTGPSRLPASAPPSQQGPVDMPTAGAGGVPGPGALLPTLAPGPPGQNDVLPGSAGESQMTLVSPISDIKDARDWAVVLGIVLVSEVVLLWGVACVSLMRRRFALSRPGAPGAGGGDADGPSRRSVWARLRRS